MPEKVSAKIFLIKKLFFYIIKKIKKLFILLTIRRILLK